MSDGVRIMAMDERLRGALVEVPHPTRIIGATGGPKLYPIRLDGEGAAIISSVVWDRVKEIMAKDPTSPRFIEVGLIKAPPTQGINGGREARPVFRHRIGHGFDTNGIELVPSVQLK